MASHVGAAVIGELAGRAVSKVLTTLSDRSGNDEKLRRLKMLVIKLRSTVEVSEKLGTETASLLDWRDKLKEAAAEGHQVLLSFQQRATPEADAATDAAKGNQGESTSGAMSVTRNALQGMAKGVRNAAAFLLAGGQGVENLNSTVDRLEKVCEDVGEFIRLLQAEASTVKAVHRPNKRKRTTEVEMELQRTRRTSTASRGCRCSADRAMVQQSAQTSSLCRPIGYALGPFLAPPLSTAVEVLALAEEDAPAKERARSTAAEKLEEASAAEEDGLPEEPAMSAAVKSLNDAVAEITRAVEMADGRDFSDLECLAEWTDVLREAKLRGRAILRIVSDAKARKQAEEGHEEDLLCSAVESVENLALDVGWFTSLVSLCTSIQ